jgi:hypothetical protein
MPRRFFTPPTVVQKLDPQQKDYRIFHEADWYGTSQVAKSYFSTGDAIYWIVRNGLFPMTTATWGYGTVLERDYDKTALLPTVDLVDAMWRVRDKGQPRWAEMMMSMSNAWYRGAYVTLEDARKQCHGNFKNAEPIRFTKEGSWPRYWFATSLIEAKTSAAFSGQLIGGHWTPTTAYVGFQPFVPASGRIIRIEESANRARFEVETSGKSFLFMSVTPHKYWSASIDGKPAKLEPANIGYQGIIVPAGKHVISMRYRNTIVARLAPISLVSALVLLFASLLGRGAMRETQLRNDVV